MRQPVIEECLAHLECRVVHILNLGSHSLVIGQVETSYISEDCVSEGKPDAEKMRPMIFNMEATTYSTFGDVVAKAYSVGLELKRGG